MSVPDSLKATSPSPSIKKDIDTNWNANSGGTPQQALADKHTNNPIDPSSVK